MGYFKINKTGCSEHKGLCEVRFDLYLSRTDEGNEEHYVTVPVFPEGGYSGEKNEIGIPIDMDAYNNWVASLPTETRNNPFCCHFCQFEPNVTDEEILFVGELALDMAMKNWRTRELVKNKNIPCNLLPIDVYKQAKEVMDGPAGVIPEPIKLAVMKIQECELRIDDIHATDFVSFSETVETTYSIRG